MTQRIYIDTSVGGYFDDEFQEATRRLFKMLEDNEVKFVISDLLDLELALADCRHIALATINRVDVLASWNFRHIVNLNRIKGYNSVNLKMGYPILEIRTPQELVSYGD